ncbi:oryzain alpha chain, partial [Olea europaea subsp. europaea]
GLTVATLLLLVSLVSLAAAVVWPGAEEKDQWVLAEWKASKDRKNYMERSEEETRKVFSEWKATYGKKYSSAAEEERRYAIFKDNLHMVDQHKADIQAGYHQVSPIGNNELSDLTNKERSAMIKGYIPLPAELRTKAEIKNWCLARGHRAAGCYDPFRCSRCLENGHWARECHNAWRPLSVLDCPVASAPRQALAPCRAQVEVSLPSNVPLRRSWASVVSAPVGSLAPADLQSALEKHADFLQEAIRPLQEVVDSLHGWLLALGGFLERAEAALARLSLAPTDPLVLPDAGKVARAEWAFMVVSLLVLG